MRIVVVGAGMQGRVIAENLLARPERPEVVVADLRQPAGIPNGATFVTTDVLNAAQAKSIATGADAVVLAVPSSISHRALRNLIAAGAAICDVSFTPDPPLSLDAEAKKSGACCVVDCGVAPGLSHILVGAAYAELGGLDSARILVGGLPQKPPAAFKHAVYFNPSDLLAEYVRPARARKNGADIAPSPFEAPVETYTDEELGKLDAFLSDGLRSLLTSFPDVRTMAELTLRWPGHLDTMRTLQELGLFEAKALESTATALASRYPEHAFPDVLVMVIEAIKGDQKRAWRLIDRRVGSQSAMSRTTGYTTAAVAMTLARKQFAQPGVHAPERLGQNPELAKAIVADLNERGVSVKPVPTEALANR